MKYTLMKRNLHEWQIKQTLNDAKGVSCTGGSMNNHTYPLLILIFAMVLSACSSKDASRFQDTLQALDTYTGFLQQLKRQDKVSTKDIVDLVKEWRLMSGSVTVCLNRDSINNKNFHTKADYERINTSIMIELDRLIDSSPRCFKDYYNLLDKLSDTKFDDNMNALVESAHAFFSSMDSVTVHKLNKHQTIKIYKNTLDAALSHGIHSKPDLLCFLKSEDVAFRLFLAHLPFWGNVPLNDIKEKTERLTKLLFESTTGEHPVMSQSEIVIFITMRNNRRLLQNAVVCVSDIQKLNFKESNQATAYLWMLLQPWLSIDRFSYALLSPEQKASFERLACEMPQVFTKLESGHFPIDLDELPSLLMKAYLSNS